MKQSFQSYVFSIVSMLVPRVYYQQGMFFGVRQLGSLVNCRDDSVVCSLTWWYLNHVSDPVISHFLKNLFSVGQQTHWINIILIHTSELRVVISV